MGQFSRVGSIVLATSLITTTLSAPIQAAIRQPFHPLPTEKGTYIALSWGDIWNRLSSKRKSGGSRGEICMIAPAKIVDRKAKPENTQEIQEIWSESPLFLWNIKRGTLQQIDLFVQGNEKPFWSRDIKAGETKIIYDGEPLQLGQIYVWKLSASVGFSTSLGGLFQVMDSQKRDRITEELTAIEERLKGASEETIALEKTDYFAQQELWSDALRELYSVPNPSAELTGMILQIEAHGFCHNDESNTSASG